MNKRQEALLQRAINVFGEEAQQKMAIEEMAELQKEICKNWKGRKIVVINQGMMTSNSPEWATPQPFFDTYNREFAFDLDVCARPENAKCQRYFTPEQDGLSQEWRGTCWMNPPYGREIGKWVKKAYETALRGGCVVCLLPSRTDTAWFHNYCMKSKDIRFIRGRLKFGGVKNSAPFPSVVVVFSAETIIDTESDEHDIQG